ncbi:MAG: DUF4114 domain-containing protein [Candidatus Bathyarchaeota archaeon]|nr:DUF4114 domain-containing protein [Candidatus Bathyarchaeota archaeon]
MKNWTKIFTLISLIIVWILSTPTVRAEEPALVSILHALGFMNTVEVTVETFVPGTYNITLYAEFAGYHNSNELSWYPVNTSDYNLIFSGSEGNYGYVDPPISKQFVAKSKFGLSFLSGDGRRYYMETSRNPDGIKHAKVYINMDDPDMYLIGFENLYNQVSDRDYNDMVLSLELITPSVVSINGVNWLFYNATNNRAMIYLDGGYAYWTYVKVFPYLQDKKAGESLFIHTMIWNGFDVITNKDWFEYNGSETSVKDAAEWLLERYYKNVFLFGYSAGGVIVAYEIQKEYASTLFSAAVVASAPVNWDPRTAPIYQSADTASKDKVATCFIAGVNDTVTSPPIPDQMMVYYNNAIIHKEWHNWTDGHDVFSYTCYDHPGEDVITATLNWFNAAHPPNIPLKPSGSISGYTGTSYPYSTCTIDPNGDNVYYIFDWDDGSTTTIGPFNSGVNIIAYHTWATSGTYNITVKARDMYGNESPCSEQLTVTITSGGGGGGGCPTLFSWNGTGYAEEALLDIHASQDVTVDYTLEHLKPAGKLCMLSLRELDNYTSHIDYVKLYAVDAEGNWHECRLIIAIHSKFGPVTAQLSLDDNVRVDLAPSQSVELFFITSNDINNIQYFIFELNGYNVKALLT